MYYHYHHLNPLKNIFNDLLRSSNGIKDIPAIVSQAAANGDPIMKEALEQAKDGRIHILAEMAKAIEKPNEIE